MAQERIPQLAVRTGSRLTLVSGQEKSEVWLEPVEQYRAFEQFGSKVRSEPFRVFEALWFESSIRFETSFFGTSPLDGFASAELPKWVFQMFGADRRDTTRQI